VFEVEEVNPGESLTVRDVRNGDVHEVRERTASSQVKAGNTEGEPLVICEASERLRSALGLEGE
jgi:hypothetical protein